MSASAVVSEDGVDTDTQSLEIYERVSVAGQLLEKARSS